VDAARIFFGGEEPEDLGTNLYLSHLKLFLLITVSYLDRIVIFMKGKVISVTGRGGP
jgi:hypothetical protein